MSVYTGAIMLHSSQSFELTPFIGRYQLGLHLDAWLLALDIPLNLAHCGDLVPTVWR